MACMRGNVGVHPVKVHGVVAILDRDEALQPLPKGGLDAGSALVGEEVSIYSHAVRPHRFPRIAYPGHMALAVGVRRRPGGGDVELETNLALADRSRIGSDATGRPADGPSTDLRERRSDRSDL